MSRLSRFSVLLRGIATIASVGLFASASFAQYSNPQLIFAARSLQFQAQQFTQVVRYYDGQDPGLVQNAQTLFDAADHFLAEVQLGPEDLPMDYRLIQDTFQRVRNNLASSYVLQSVPSVRSVWFHVQESNLNLQQVWSNSGYGGQPQPGYPQPGYPQPGYPQPGYPNYPRPGHPYPGFPGEGSLEQFCSQFSFDAISCSRQPQCYFAVQYNRCIAH